MRVHVRSVRGSGDPSSARYDGREVDPVELVDGEGADGGAAQEAAAEFHGEHHDAGSLDVPE